MLRILVITIFACGVINAQILIDQDFEDTNIFVMTQAFDKVGLGDSMNMTGLWSNTLITGNYTPDTSFGSSFFSLDGSQCMHLRRTDTYGAGFATGLRSDMSITGEFVAEFSIKVAKFCNIPISLVDSAGNGGSQVAVAFFGNKINVRDNGEWKAKTGRFSEDRWVRVKLVGNVAIGQYRMYVDYGNGWELVTSDPVGFDNSVLSSISGFQASPWDKYVDIYFDDFKLASLPLTDCEEVKSLGYNLSTDLTNDCQVNIDDLATLASEWLMCIDPMNVNCAHPWDN